VQIETMTTQNVLAILGGMALGSFLGLLLGALIGGNWATSFELLGLRGYEATGIVGLCFGLALGGYAGARLTSRRASRF
jgi:hypothetical protein